jgi:molybdenum cofactor biosynthesis protein A
MLPSLPLRSTFLSCRQRVLFAITPAISTTTTTRTTPTTKRQCRFSSNAALWEEDEEDQTLIAGAVKGEPRPRLEALRRQLQEDNNTNIIIDKTTTKSTNGRPKNLSFDQAKKTASSLSAEEDKEDKEKSLLQLMNKLESLPLPEEPLIDKFGRQHSYLRISLSERCNLRCLYCMPEDGVPLQPAENLLSNDEIMKLATWFNQQGVNKIRLTGGEPLLRKNLVELITDLNKLKLEQIGMTTNGVTLSKQLPDLVDAGLTHVNISLDSLNADKFARLTRRPPSYHTRVMDAIKDCAKYLPNQTKINCVVMPDNVNELQDFCELSRDLPVDIRFIEYMPFNDNQWGSNEFVSYKQMQEEIAGLEREEDGPNDTTKWWRLQPNENHENKSLGRIGFITSMSEHFCGTCNRLRLTADGQLKVCLFGETEVSLRDLMRQGGSNEMLQKVIHYSVQRKNFKLGGHEDMEDLRAHSAENRPMILIGG